LKWDRPAARAVAIDRGGFDSIHLASALWLKTRVSESVKFAVFERRLGAAATKAGLTVVP